MENDKIRSSDDSQMCNGPVMEDVSCLGDAREDAKSVCTQDSTSSSAASDSYPGESATFRVLEVGNMHSEMNERLPMRECPVSKIFLQTFDVS